MERTTCPGSALVVSLEAHPSLHTQIRVQLNGSLRLSVPRHVYVQLQEPETLVAFLARHLGLSPETMEVISALPSGHYLVCFYHLLPEELEQRLQRWVQAVFA